MAPSPRALLQGRGLEGAVYAAARKAADLQPLNPAALNTLGLACEARGDFAGAVRAYQAALQLLPFAGEWREAKKGQAGGAFFLHTISAQCCGAGGGAEAAGREMPHCS